MKLPTIMINFKTYQQASGKDAEELIKICEEVTKETKKSISCCPQAPDIYRCSKYEVPILAQHEDPEDAGGHTGKITVKAIKENGAIGSLINHSENRIPFEKINQLIFQLREEDLISVVCVKDTEEARHLAKLNPDFIAIEPPELIGGNVSVTNANPEIIINTVKAVQEVDKNIKILCGAGVKTGEDVKEAIKLGTSGVLIASGVTKAKNKKEAIMNLVNGII